MRILHYISSIDRNVTGVSSYMQTLCRAIGDKVELHVVTHHSENELELANCTIHYISHDWYWVGGRIKRQYEALLDDIKPDVVHCNSCWMPWFAYAVIYAKRKGYKVVLTPHGMLEPWIIKRNYWMKKWPALMLFQRRAIAMADVLHATADSERYNLASLGYNKNIVVIPNCVEIAGVKMKNSWHRRRRILYMGRLHEKKGIKHLIDAFVLFCNNQLSKFPTLGILSAESVSLHELVIAGESDINTPHYKEELMDYTKMHGLENMVRFIGGVYGEEKYNLIRESDVFVLPTYSENFGIVVPEALACGTPVITTEGTPWQELETEHCGWWTEIGTESLVCALRDFLGKSDEELETMGRNGRRLIEQKYSMEQVAHQYINLYNQLNN